MADELRRVAGLPVLVCDPAGEPISSPGAAAEVIGACLGEGAQVCALPVSRLAPQFLDLRSGLAGEVLQKFVNYKLQVAIVGEVPTDALASKALRDFVRESNRGRHIWFVADMAELESRLSA